VGLEHRWNLNILCVDAEEDILKLYQDVLTFSTDRVAMIMQKYIQRQYGVEAEGSEISGYKVFPAMSGQAAIRNALEAKNKEEEMAVGFFDIGIEGEASGLDCIREVKRIFPSLLCAVVAITDLTDQSVSEIRKIFESQDEWLYIKKPFTKEELLQTACNLVVSWNLRTEQNIAMNKIKESQERVQRLLVVTPKLFRLQTYEELCKNVVEEAADSMGTEHAFLAMRMNGKLEFMAGRGKFAARKEEDKQKFLKVLDSASRWDQGCLVPLSLGETPLGLLFVDELKSENRDTEILELFTSQAAYAFENIRIQEEREEQKARAQELKIGKNIQQSLLPKTIPTSKDIELYGLMQSAKEIGGDYYDFLYREIQPNQITEDIYVSIGDVAGKGVAAGLIMSEVRSFIRALIPFYSTPREILDQVARLLEKDIWGTGRFVSLLLMFWDAKKKKFLFSSAGHEHIIHYQAKQKKCSVFKAGGVVLGLKYDIVSPHLKLEELIFEAEDMIVLFTDGVTEAMNEKGRMFTLENLIILAEQYAHLPVDQAMNNIFQSVIDFIGNNEQFDDITIVGIKRKKE
jgi:serine phosphatase RsbU (regulator of sigma subunit)/CheY-like chemotaxis protein